LIHVEATPAGRSVTRQTPGDPGNVLDIIIVNYNSTDYLLRCLASVIRSLGDLPARIFVEDNDSRDRPERIGERFPAVRLTLNRRNLGFGAAVNQALRRSRSPFVVLLNPDSLVQPGLFTETLAYLRCHPRVAVIGPRILDGDGAIQGSARSFPTPLTGFFGRKSLFTRLFPNNPITSANLLTSRSDGTSPMEVDWVSGACMVVRRQAIDAVGLFDERFFMYWEDADWCRRMGDAGWKVVYLPGPTVMHYVGVSSDQLMLRSTYEFHKSSYLLFDKYNRLLPWLVRPLILCGLFLRLCFVVGSAEIALCLGRLGQAGLAVRRPRVGRRGRIKVLRMIARLNIGGPAIHVHLLTQGLDRTRFESQLVAGNISPQEGDMSYLFAGEDTQPFILPELQRDIRLQTDLKALLQFFRILEREKPDIVHTHTAKAGFTARFAVLVYNLLFRRRVHVVHTFHGHVFEGYFSRGKTWLFVMIERFMARFTSVIIAISETQKQDLAHKFRIAPPSKIRAIELGFDLNPFLNCRKLEGRFRRRIEVGPDVLLIGIIGRLVPIKNHRMFLQVVKIFLVQNPAINVRFLVFGDGELREELMGQCRRQGLERHVRFHGWTRDVAGVYADLNVLALTSLNEGTPVSIIEAMASSVPVVATDAGGVLDLLGSPDGEHGDRGFKVCERGVLCRKGDAFGFARGLRHVVQTERAVTRERSRRARDFVCRRFSKERLIADIETLYSELAERPAERRSLGAGAARPLVAEHSPLRLPAAGCGPHD
jgi:GT2 family glycosyltransferase/glycogen synthase